ncbi:MAG: SPASM domain-containing protein [Deltaproteobacteria bacterium]|nr:SPASM domain-containing protein [Deltaproteobacteria bacterium]
MSLDVFRSCIGKLPVAVDIHFSGMCEPWLNPECADMILYAHGRGHRIKVSTTLTGLEIDDIDRIASIPFKFFNVHLPLREEGPQDAVAEHYLTLLERLDGSNIDVTYRCHGASVAPEVELLLGPRIRHSKPHTRAGNRELAGSALPRRKRGHIGCRRLTRQNVLLPNGDVTLCCMDYGLQHVLGNLLSGDYDALLRSDELLRVRKGLRDGSEEILCRYCDAFAYHVSPFGRIADRTLERLLELRRTAGIG